MRSQKAIAYVALSIFLASQLSGCGGGSLGGGGGTTPATVTSVSASASPKQITTTQTAQASASVYGTGNFSSGVSWTVTPVGIGTVSASGIFAPATTGTATLTACSTMVGYTSICGSATVTVTEASHVTSVTVTPDQTTITTAQTATVTADVQGTGPINSAVTWTVTGGTIIGTGNTVTLVPTGIGTMTATATSVQDTTKFGSASITVTRGAPVIDSVTINGTDPWIFCPGSCFQAQVAFVISGTGFQAGDQINFSGYWDPYTLRAEDVSADGTQAAAYEMFGANQTPSFIFFTDVPQDGTPAGNTRAFAYLNGYNGASHGQNGYFLNKYGKVYVWQKNADGSLTNTESFAGDGLNAAYETDGTNGYFVAGFSPYTLDGVALSSVSNDGWAVSGTSAENGTAIVVEPNGNEVALYRPVPSPQNPVTNRVPAGTMPYTSVMTTVNGTTYGYIASVDGTPTLRRIDTNGASAGSAPLTGVTSLTDINFSNRFLTGGWPMAIFHNGPGAGKVAVVSTHDKGLLVFDDTSDTLPLLKTVPLPCSIPWAIDAVDSVGKLFVQCIKVAGFTDSGSTFLSIDTATWDVTTLKSVSINAPNGFPTGFLADTDSVYTFSGPGAPDVQPNQ